MPYHSSKPRLAGSRSRQAAVAFILVTVLLEFLSFGIIFGHRGSGVQHFPTAGLSTKSGPNDSPDQAEEGLSYEERQAFACECLTHLAARGLLWAMKRAGLSRWVLSLALAGCTVGGIPPVDDPSLTEGQKNLAAVRAILAQPPIHLHRRSRREYSARFGASCRLVAP